MRFLKTLIGALIAGAACVAFITKTFAANESSADAHAQHQAEHAESSRAVARSTASYPVPNIKLVRQDGRLVNLRDELNDDRPVVMAFIYTSCATVCPMTSHTLSELQAKLGANRDRVHLVSVSIDPEQDTPSRLREYAKTFDAGPEWQYYGGSREASEAVQRAFDVYRGAKMDHPAAILVRPSPGAPWVRLEGFPTAEQLYVELPGSLLSASR